MNSDLQRREESRAAVAARPATMYSPATDIVEEGEKLVIRIDMPGVDKEHLSVRFADGVLTITGAREHKPNGMKLRHEEFGNVRYSRAFTIPDTIDAGKTEASLINGVLTLALPKIEAARPRKIDVKIQ
ncbi:MAG: Hsp20/alpha crystallin family protein [Planctomycetota bacterium]